ncbi:Nickel import ATP-binding protein NikO [subsurface metagenome]
MEYLKFVCKFQYVPKNEINQRINDIIELFELENDKNKPIKILSSGNQMKVTLGAAIIHNPELLVLDEPFINIDIATTEKIMSILKGFKGKKTIFITSHNLDLVIELCDNFLIMDKGKIIQNINKTDFKNTTTLKEKVKKLLVKEYKEINLSWLG